MPAVRWKQALGLFFVTLALVEVVGWIPALLGVGGWLLLRSDKQDRKSLP